VEENLNILSKEEIVCLYKTHKQNLCRVLKSQYINTYNFINSNFKYVKLTNIHNNSGKNKFTEKIYQYVYDIKGVCKQCDINPTTFRSFSDGYFDFCSQKCQQINTASKYGVKNLFQSDEIKNRMEKTWSKKYGFNHPNKSENQKIKIKNTKKEKYGNENYVNTEKLKQTCLERYGVTNPNKLKKTREKIKKTSLERYGVENYSQTKEYKEKTIKTNLLRYGYENINQSPEFQQKLQKKSYRFKPFILPSGKEIKVQGYEPFALNILLETYNENDIVVDRAITPKFWYILNEKRKIYYPDFFIKSSNTIIETKSDWTDKLHPIVDELKKQSVLKEGYNFRKMVFDRKGKLLNE
jgi:hypothetical protein